MINIGIVDDHVVVREGFKQLINLESDLIVVAEYGTYEETFEGFPKQTINILIVDILLHGKNGIELIANIKKQYPDILCIAVSMYDNEPYVSEATSSGANAYLSKRVASEELIKAIRYVCEGKFYISNDVAANIQEVHSHIEKPSALTFREMQVCKLLAKGFSIKLVSSHLDVQPKTIHAHKANIFKKLKIVNRYELLKYALSMGMLNIDDLVN